MIIKAVFYGLAFVVTIIFLTQIFDMVYTNLEVTINAMNDMKEMIGITSEVVDKSLVNYTFDALKYAVFLFPLSAVSILLIWGIHSRKR